MKTVCENTGRSWLGSLEWAFPLRGRWLVYLLRGLTPPGIAAAGLAVPPDFALVFCFVGGVLIVSIAGFLSIEDKVAQGPPPWVSSVRLDLLLLTSGICLAVLGWLVRIFRLPFLPAG
jgi:hypothetical protein